MDGFKNTTKTSYDTTSGRKFASGGMTVSRNDMPGGQGPMDKPAMVAKYAKGGSVKKGEAKIAKVMGEFASGKLHSGSKKGPEVKNPKQAVAIAMSEARKAGAKMPMKKAMGGPVKMREGGTFNERGQRATLAEMEAEDRRMAGRKAPTEGVSSRPTDSSGRRASNADLGMGQLTAAEAQMLKTAAKKPVVKGAAAGAAAGSGVMAAARAAARAAATRFGGQVTAAEMQMLKAAAAKKGVPAHSDKPMIRRKTGGLAVMPKGKC
jgi:hypothetical protein